MRIAPYTNGIRSLLRQAPWSPAGCLQGFGFLCGTVALSDPREGPRPWPVAWASRALAQQEVERRAVERLGIFVQPGVR